MFLKISLFKALTKKRGREPDLQWEMTEKEFTLLEDIGAFIWIAP